MSGKIVHMLDGAISTVPLVIKTRCGRKIDRPIFETSSGAAYSTLTAHNGNQFFCTTNAKRVTCGKCSNLLRMGTLHGSRPSGTADAKKQFVSM